MTAPIVTILISAGVAVSATLLTIFLTPRLQHYFWKRQRRAELCLAAIDEINNLTSEFITNYIEAEHKEDRDFRPTVEFFQSFQAAGAKIKALFSDQTFQDFKNMEIMIGPNLGPSSLHRTVDDFIQARDASLRSLYKEVGILPRKFRS